MPKYKQPAVASLISMDIQHKNTRRAFLLQGSAWRVLSVIVRCYMTFSFNQLRMS